MKEVYESAKEAAEAIGTSQATVSNWFKVGRLKAERVPRGGKSALRIRHADLIEASRGTLFEQPGETAQLGFAAPEDPRKDALTLEVFWPEEQRAQRFTTEMLAGFSTFRALTYTVSLPSILKLLTTQNYDQAEVVFGSEALVRETKAETVVLFQAAIEDEITRGYIGIGGESDPRTQQLMAWQAEGRAKFYAAAGGVIHSKLYFLERPGLRRVLVGSANLSERAMSGRQGEVLFAYDNNSWVWDNLSRKYEAALSLSAGLQLKTQVKPAHIVRAEDLPVGREVKNAPNESVTIFTFEATDIQGDPEYLAVRAAELDSSLGEGLRENIRAMPRGESVIRATSLQRINYAAAPNRPEDPAKFHKLDRVNDRFIYDGRAIERPESSEVIERDALLISQYITKFQEFGEESDDLQRNYFGLMGWLYFTPFMPGLARELHRMGANASKDLKHLAVVYGQSNCGKSAMTKFLLTSMFGPPATIDDSGFTQSDFKLRTRHVGVLPIYYEDVSGNRFSGRTNNQGEVIVKYYDQLVSRTGVYPCAVATANAEATEFANEVRNRAFLVYTPKGIASEDDDTRKRLDREVLPLLNRVGAGLLRRVSVPHGQHPG